MNETEIIKTSGIKKIYGGTVALAGADLSFRKGEVHALAGENGAGKSTFCKILSGAISPTSGEVVIDGTVYKRLTPAESRAVGISMIYQEFNMVNDVPVYENIFIGSEIRKNGIIVDKKQMIQRTQEIFRKMEVDVDPKAFPRDLSVAQCQLVEIAKALKDNCKVLVMDEPTANLDYGNQIRVLSAIREYDAQNHTNLEQTALVYVKENMEIAAAAKALFQHPNTVRYRLSKIQRIMGMEDDPLFAPMLSLTVSMSRILTEEQA